MKLIFLAIFSFLLISNLDKFVCLETAKGIEKVSASSFELEFDHSIYGGKVTLSASVFGEKILVEEIRSGDEASISYYTDLYILKDGRFVSKIKEEREELIVNDGWKLRFKNGEIITKDLTKIFVCR